MQRNKELARLKSIAEGWRQEWRLRVYELARQRLAVRRARARWRLAAAEYRRAAGK